MRYQKQAKKLIKDASIRLKYQGFSEAFEYTTSQIYHNFYKRQIRGEEFSKGSLPYGEDWDALIILDACRADAFSMVIDELEQERIQSTSTRRSVGGKSLDWMMEMFNQENKSEIDDLAYITANPHTDIVMGDDKTVNSGDFETLDEVWKYGWDEEVGTVKPEVVTDRAIDIARSSNPSRMIVHYMQPHFPSIPNPSLGSEVLLDTVGEDWPDSIWERCLRGEVSKEEVWEAYIENARYVLQSVNTLIENINADRVIITADHGNAIGEKGFYGHGGYPVDEVWEVPWCVVHATDLGSHQPTVQPPEQSTNTDVRSRLRSLGYME